MPEIVPLPREKYAGVEIPFEYDTEMYYDVRVSDTAQGFSVDFVQMPFPEPVHKRFVDELYEAHWEAPEAYGIFDGERLTAVLEVSKESWNNRLRVLNLWVDWPFRRHGYGTLLMDRAKALAIEKGCRAIVLETQSCNSRAIAFYLAQGFRLSGFDSACYSNEDIAKKEVRMEMLYIPPKAAHEV